MTKEHLMVIREFQKVSADGENWQDYYIIKGDHRQELLEELSACGGRGLDCVGIYNDTNSAPAGAIYHGSIIIDGLDDYGNTIIYQYCGYNI